jgi:hypothetical protein
MIYFSSNGNTDNLGNIAVAGYSMIHFRVRTGHVNYLVDREVSVSHLKALSPVLPVKTGTHPNAYLLLTSFLLSTPETFITRVYIKRFLEKWSKPVKDYGHPGI